MLFSSLEVFIIRNRIENIWLIGKKKVPDRSQTRDLPHTGQMLQPNEPRETYDKQSHLTMFITIQVLHTGRIGIIDGVVYVVKKRKMVNVRFRFVPP